jgi:anti-sigma B factor antagonist
LSSELSEDIAALDRTDVPGYVDFSVSVTAGDGEAVVHVRGDLDCYAAPRLRAVLSEVEAAADGPRRIVLDVGQTNFMDSTGLGVLVGGVRRLRLGGGDMVLRSPSPSTRRLLEITGVTKLFEIV